MSIGQLVEDLHCNGIPDGRTLTPQERLDIVEFALSFEECQEPRDVLEAKSDKDLVMSAYWIMAEYASGQV